MFHRSLRRSTRPRADRAPSDSAVATTIFTVESPQKVPKGATAATPAAAATPPAAGATPIRNPGGPSSHSGLALLSAADCSFATKDDTDGNLATGESSDGVGVDTVDRGATLTFSGAAGAAAAATSTGFLAAGLLATYFLVTGFLATGFSEGVAVEVGGSAVVEAGGGAGVDEGAVPVSPASGSGSGSGSRMPSTLIVPSSFPPFSTTMDPNETSPLTRPVERI